MNENMNTLLEHEVNKKKKFIEFPLFLYNSSLSSAETKKTIFIDISKISYFWKRELYGCEVIELSIDKYTILLDIKLEEFLNYFE